MFADRVEIISVGGLLEGLTLEEFYEEKSKPVNLELQQIMVQLDYVEQTGHESWNAYPDQWDILFNHSDNF